MRELNRTNTKIEKWNFAPKFIISTGRTGTKFFAYFLDSLSDEIKAEHEPKPVCMKLRYQFGVGRISLEKAVKYFIKNRDDIYRSIQQSDIYIEANPFFSLLIPVIQEVFSNYKILHIIRDGRDYVRSSMSRNVLATPFLLTSLFKIFPHPIQRPYSAFLNNSICDAWRIRAVDFPYDPYRKKWHHMTRFEKLTWHWKKVDEAIYNAIKEDKNALTVRFEEIFNEKNKYDGIRKILKFFDLEMFWESAQSDLENYMSTKINKTKKYTIPHWTKWDSDLKEKFIYIAGDYLLQNGYSW